VESLARILGCRVALVPMTYLGLPLDAPYTSLLLYRTALSKKWRGS